MSRILHVWDQAGVACVLAKYQRRLGHKVDVIKREGFDKFDIMKFYGEKIYKTWFGRQFLKIALNESQNYDIIHIHDIFKLVPMIRAKYPGKKIILHYHGTILRKTPKSERESAETEANSILVSTKDLLDFVKARYLPNPVDIEHFRSREILENNKAVSLMSNTETDLILKDFIKKINLDVEVEIIPRERKPIPYSQMPDFLSKYEYLVDLKMVYENKPAPVFTLTGLQALSLGLKVINYEKKILNQFPRGHLPDLIAKDSLKIYNF